MDSSGLTPSNGPFAICSAKGATIAEEPLSPVPVLIFVNKIEIISKYKGIHGRLLQRGPFIPI